MSRAAADKAYNWASHWMIFDIATQHWTFFMNDLSFVTNCCRGSILTVRNVHYYFNNDVGGSNGLSPIYRILDNGTSIDLEISEIPFAKEYSASWTINEEDPSIRLYSFMSIVLAPFYQRFYEDVPI